ncbi:MAG: CotH kinase family protein [Bacteroidales bacterium]|nr:CotH kinase family protein [Bacteroidales bacterium]
MKILILIIAINLPVVSNYAQNGMVEIDPIYISEDVERGIVLINQEIDELNSLYPEEKKTIQSGNHHYTFVSSIEEFEYGKTYEATDSESKYFEIYFTQLPVINIFTNNTIVDEPRVYAQFSLCQSNGDYIANSIGIEYRGGWTQTLPKKSFRIEFWKDETGSKTRNISILGMRSDDDWNIQAMYNEPLRLRSKANFEMWRKIDTLYYIGDEPEAINGVHQEYVELFLNNQYRGVYALSERPDRKQFKLKKYKEGEIRGELYKGIGWGGASTYTSLSSYDNSSKLWDGFEYEYPLKEISWGNIYEFVKFVIDEDSIVFSENYEKRFDIDNAVNYFIFLNLLRATDNTGKNIVVAKYNMNEPYFYIPWDLDGTYGIIWNGTQENITNDILTNGFYDRLLKYNSFRNRLKIRWNELRENLITHDNIMGILNTQFEYLKSNGVYKRELIAWPDCNFLDFDNLIYTSNWLNRRLDYLDHVFNNPELLIGIKQITKQNQIRIYPNPASQYLNIKTEDITVIENVKIINSLGACVYNNNKITGSIDISGLSNGIYIVIIDFGNGETQIGKIMIISKQ